VARGKKGKQNGKFKSVSGGSTRVSAATNESLGKIVAAIFKERAFKAAGRGLPRLGKEVGHH